MYKRWRGQQWRGRPGPFPRPNDPPCAASPSSPPPAVSIHLVRTAGFVCLPPPPSFPSFSSQHDAAQEHHSCPLGGLHCGGRYAVRRPPRRSPCRPSSSQCRPHSRLLRPGPTQRPTKVSHCRRGRAKASLSTPPQIGSRPRAHAPNSLSCARQRPPRLELCARCSTARIAGTPVVLRMSCRV